MCVRGTAICCSSCVVESGRANSSAVSTSGIGSSRPSRSPRAASRASPRRRPRFSRPTSGARSTGPAEGSAPSAQRGVHPAGRVVLRPDARSPRRRARGSAERAARAAGGTPHVLELAARRGWPHGLRPTGECADAHAVRVRAPDARATARLGTDDGGPGALREGCVRHPDHATIVLRTWHRVLMNTESRAEAMRFVTFVD